MPSPRSKASPSSKSREGPALAKAGSKVHSRIFNVSVQYMRPARLGLVAKRDLRRSLRRGAISS